MKRGAILVTGAAGLVGNAVRVRLEESGTPVLPIDRVPQTEEGREIVVCDLTDPHRLHAVSVGREIAGIVHCGAYSGPMVERDNPNAIVRVNIGGTANVLELARIHRIPRVVFCSSTSAYGRTPKGPVREDVPLAPTSVYGASKVASEQLVSSYASQHEVDGVSLRLSWVYGPRRTTDCVIRTMIEDAYRGRATRMPWGQDFHRQYIYVDDAASALIAALDAPALPRRIYNVTGGTCVTLGEVGEIVRRVLPAADIQLAGGPDPIDTLQNEFDISAAREDLGYQPRIDLETGIRNYAQWLEQRLER
jgi:nucleoside-diphosphate-sugar epimerase